MLRSRSTALPRDQTKERLVKDKDNTNGIYETRDPQTKYIVELQQRNRWERSEGKLRGRGLNQFYRRETGKLLILQILINILINCIQHSVFD